MILGILVHKFEVDSLASEVYFFADTIVNDFTTRSQYSCGPN